MDHVFVIGLPHQLRGKLEAGARRRDTYITCIPAGAGKKGYLQLLPHPDAAVHKLHEHCDQLERGYAAAYVLVLPYAPVPAEVIEELAALADLGAEVVQGHEGEEDWPVLGKNKIDTVFLNRLYERILREIFGQVLRTPAEHFQWVSEQNRRIVIVEGALDRCNEIAAHRHEFMRRTAEAFAHLVQKNGQIGRVDAFFRELGLEHAQTGGISISLEIRRDGESLHSATASTHIKQGDNTTPQAAARVYYQTFFIEQQFHLAVLYAGPHPDRDLTCVHEIAGH
ncbi:MAG: hypothetical protein ISP90_06710 [Nevskia sp.]|nr:hypothetical protein [Nevskia sp.]